MFQLELHWGGAVSSINLHIERAPPLNTSFSAIYLVNGKLSVEWNLRYNKLSITEHQQQKDGCNIFHFDLYRSN